MAGCYWIPQVLLSEFFLFINFLAWFCGKVFSLRRWPQRKTEFQSDPLLTSKLNKIGVKALSKGGKDVRETGDLPAQFYLTRMGINWRYWSSTLRFQLWPLMESPNRSLDLPFGFYSCIYFLLSLLCWKDVFSSAL